MHTLDRKSLLKRLEETRSNIENLLPDIDPNKEIYPGWTLKDLIAHMTGWDDAVIDALQSHLVNRAPTFPVISSLDKYNSLTVSSRKGLNFEHVLGEWRKKRQLMLSIIMQLPNERYTCPVLVPWGGKTTVNNLVEIFREHEEEHARDILAWLQKTDKTLT